MVQVCERPARYMEARRLSAEEFCELVRREAGSIYRPRSEVLRMLAVGEAWGVCGLDHAPEAALLVLPVDADVSVAAALRETAGCAPNCRGYFLTPPVGGDSPRLPKLMETALDYARRRAPGSPVWAVMECTPDAENTIDLYLQQGLALRALRPLNSLSPCYLFTSAEVLARQEPVWVPMSDPTHIALLLSRGWAAVASRVTAHGPALALCPV